MKKLQLAFAALVLASTLSFAQPANKQDRKQHGKHEQKNKIEDLDLSDDQKAQMKAANEDFKAQMKALKNDGNQTVAQQRDKRAALAQAHKTRLDNILTTEQRAKRATLHANGRQQHGEMNARHMERMQKELNLTTEQINQLKNSDEAMKSKLENIKNNSSLDEAAKRQQLTALREERKAMMEKVLTAEQKEKWQGMHKEQKGHQEKHRGAKRMKKAATV